MYADCCQSENFSAVTFTPHVVCFGGEKVKSGIPGVLGGAAVGVHICVEGISFFVHFEKKYVQFVA